LGESRAGVIRVHGRSYRRIGAVAPFIFFPVPAGAGLISSNGGHEVASGVQQSMKYARIQQRSARTIPIVHPWQNKAACCRGASLSKRPWWPNLLGARVRDELAKFADRKSRRGVVVVGVPSVGDSKEQAVDISLRSFMSGRSLESSFSCAAYCVVRIVLQRARYPACGRRFPAASVIIGRSCRMTPWAVDEPATRDVRSSLWIMGKRSKRRAGPLHLSR
jgi:hypothetical protein